MHTPVLLHEAIEQLHITKSGRYIDATVGEGGHLQKIIELGGNVLAIDIDKNQIENLKLKVKNSDQIIFAVGNYRDIENIAKNNNFYPVDGILFDLGLSMNQLIDSGKGLSFKNLEEPLDMRLSEEIELGASDLLNTLSKENLYDIFARYSEEIHSELIADYITRLRIKAKIESVSDILEIIDIAIRNCSQKHDHDLVKIYTRIFQALRIVVNEEFENIKQGLQGAVNIISAQGRIVIITFHSLEDRIVKNFARQNNLKLEQKVFGDKSKSFERSATLRVITK